MTKETFTIQSDPGELEGLRKNLRKSLEGFGFQKAETDKILVAIGEACTNSMRHSYGGEKGQKIEITAEDRPDKTLFRIRDFGRKIDLTRIREPELPPASPGGLGIYFMKTIMDVMEYNTAHPEGNEVILTKYKSKGKQAS